MTPGAQRNCVLGVVADSPVTATYEVAALKTLAIEIGVILLASLAVPVSPCTDAVAKVRVSLIAFD
jgi:hypothetical protein